MLSFYYTTVWVMSVLFVVSLLAILYLTYTQESKTGGIDTSKPFPPVQQRCPDLWQFVPNNNSPANGTGGTSPQGVCRATFMTVPSDNLKKNLGVYVNAVTGAPQTAEMAAINKNNPASMVYTPATSTAGATLTFNPDDDFFKQSTSSICGRKFFTVEKNITWEGVGNYNPC